MAGAVVVVEAGGPQRRRAPARRAPSRWCRPGSARGQRQVALQHQGEALAHLRRRLADGDGAGDVGGAVQVLGAGVDQQQRAALERAWPGAWSGGSGRWRRWTPAPAMVSKDRSFSAPVASRKPSSRRHHLQLVGQARSGLGGHPVQEAGQAPRRRGCGRGGRLRSRRRSCRRGAGRWGPAPRTTSAPAALQAPRSTRPTTGRGSTSTACPWRGRPARRAGPRASPGVTPLPSQAGRSGVTLAGIEEQPRRAVGVRGSPGRAAGASGSRRRRGC